MAAVPHRTRELGVLILPAIDIRGGQCVRLRQGDFAQETVFDADPVAVARRFVGQGAKCLHVVDLDGAKAGHPVNGDTIASIVRAAGVPVQLGGGLRSEEHVAEVLGWGVERVVLGTRALMDPLWFRGVCENNPDKVMLGLDARDDKLATHGWLEYSENSPVDLARKFALWPLAGIVYTDIGRDGMLQGPALDSYTALRAAVDVPIVASGGVTTLQNLRDLARTGVAGCIIGRALYEGRLDLAAAIAATKDTA